MDARRGVVRKKSLLRVGVFLGALLLLLFVLTLSLPFFLDVNRYRPQIESLVRNHIHGQFEIGRLSLSLLGQIQIDIEDLELRDDAGSVVLSVASTYFHFSFLSLLKGEPRLILKFEEPQISVVRSREGLLNVFQILKKNKEEPGQKENSTGEESQLALPSYLMSLLSASGFDLEMSKARFTYDDIGSGTRASLDSFDLKMLDLSMTSPFQMTLETHVSTLFKESLKVEGPLSVKAIVTPTFNRLHLDDLAISMEVDGSDLNIQLGKKIRKSREIPARVEVELLANQERLDCKKWIVFFHNARLSGHAMLRGLDTADPEIELATQSDAIDLGPWADLFPEVKSLNLDGRADFSAHAKGHVKKIEYGANLSIQNLSLEVPGLLAKPLFQSTLQLETNHLKKFNLSMAAPQNNIDLSLEVKNFQNPSVFLKVDSSGLNLDELLPAKPRAASSDSSLDSDFAEAVSEHEDEVETDFDALLEGVRENSILKSAQAVVDLRLASLKRQDIQIEELSMKARMKDLAARISPFHFKVFDGKLNLDGAIDIKAKQPHYEFAADIQGLNLESATRSTLKSWRNTIFGSLFFSAKGKGSSLNSSRILPNLNAKGSFQIKDATFATLDVGKMASEALHKSLTGLSSKFSGLLTRGVGTPQGYQSQYKEIGGQFSLGKGVFLAEDFYARSLPQKGIDLKGRTKIDLLQDGLKAEWSLIDTYNLTKARNVEINKAGLKIERILAEKGDPVRFPVKIGCKLSAPCYEYTAAVDHFARVILENTRKGASQALDAKKDQVVTELEKKRQN